MLATRPQVTMAGRTVRAAAEPVAAVLADGTIVPLVRGIRARVDERLEGWSEGMLSGKGWTLWWQRRGG